MIAISDIITDSMLLELNRRTVYDRMSEVMKCDVSEVKEKISCYGGGHIYTSGVIVSDTPRNRHKLTDMYGEIVIILDDGTVIVRDRNSQGRINRKVNAFKSRTERFNAMKEREERRKKLATERMFEDCKGVSSPKRQGQCHGVRCVYHPASSLDRSTPRSQDVFITIKLKY